MVEAFLHFGGYVLPIPGEGRFKIYRPKAAVRSRVGDGAASSDPQEFRIPFGQSETIQSRYELDGLGRLYEDDRKIADSAAAWIEGWSKNP